MAKTMGGRLALGLCLFASASHAAESVTEPEAVGLFLEQSPQARRVPLVVRSASAESRGPALLSNPTVAYETEDAGGVRDRFLTLQQALPISGRRGLAREGAEAAASAAGFAADRDLRTAASALRESFYEVLYREQVAERLRRATERVERIVEILAEREREGEGSGYDLLRAEQELAEIEIGRSGADTRLAVARVRFGSFFAAEREMASARLEGELEPSGATPAADAAIELALSERGDLKALRAAASRFDFERRAARRQRIPEPTLTAGWKRTEAVGLDDTGFVAALTMPLPVFDRGQLAAARAEAERQSAELEREILEKEVRADVHAALARERAAREAARQHGGDVDRRAGELRRIAELAYDEGEAGILELLDAHRSSLGMELRALALRYEARRAEIDRDHAIGTEVRP